MARTLTNADVPVVLVVNKIDRIAEKSRLLQFLNDEVKTDRFSDVFLVSAKSGDGVDRLEKKVLLSLPFSRPFYDEDMFTDRSERFLAAELVREQLMLRLHQELPYALTVEIEQFNQDFHHSYELLSTGVLPRQNFDFLQHAFCCEVQPCKNLEKIHLRKFVCKVGQTNVLLGSQTTPQIYT